MPGQILTESSDFMDLAFALTELQEAAYPTRAEFMGQLAVIAYERPDEYIRTQNGLLIMRSYIRAWEHNYTSGKPHHWTRDIGDIAGLELPIEHYNEEARGRAGVASKSGQMHVLSKQLYGIALWPIFDAEARIETLKPSDKTEETNSKVEEELLSPDQLVLTPTQERIFKIIARPRSETVDKLEISSTTIDIQIIKALEANGNVSFANLVRAAYLAGKIDVDSLPEYVNELDEAERDLLPIILTPNKDIEREGEYGQAELAAIKKSIYEKLGVKKSLEAYLIGLRERLVP